MMVFLFRTLRARHICIVIRLKIFRRSWLTQSPGKFFLTRQRWLNSDNASNATSIQWYISLETTLIDGIFAWKRGYLVKKGIAEVMEEIKDYAQIKYKNYTFH